MTVNGINGGPAISGQNNADSWKQRMDAALGRVAGLFNENVDQLESDLKTGNTSLTALAQSKGVSQDNLISAIKSGLQQASANGGPQMSDSQLTNIANNIANRTHGAHGHHHGHHHKADNDGDSTQTSAPTVAPAS
jgi:hypothetical protein